VPEPVEKPSREEYPVKTPIFKKGPDGKEVVAG
jgi:hypothetical protein